MNFDYQHNCKLCGKFCNGKRSLGNHLAKSHKSYNIKTYVFEFLLKEIPLCKCGCLKQVSWKSNEFKFNDFINGHNNKFNSKNQPIFSKEQIEKRNNAIRKIYKSSEGDNIKNKISKSILNALDNDLRKKLSKGQKERYKKPGELEKISIARKQTWKDQYDSIYKKIFTPEFGRKISASNRTRDIKKVSNEEIKFLELLRNVIDVKIINSYWINDKNINKCFDAYIPSENLLIEYDGVYWHGLDRTSNFGKLQIESIKNDVIKNDLALKLGFNLFRIASDAKLYNINNIESLINTAYHIQKNSIIIREGTKPVYNLINL